MNAVYLVPLLPLVGFAVLVVAGRRLGDPGAGWAATAAIGGAFVATCVTWVSLLGREAEERSVVKEAFDWIPLLRVKVAFLVDPLSVTMALFVTGVGTLIHLYSVGYMRGDPRYPRFFVYMNLFAFSMLVLVLGDNLLVTFVGWEGVGACSYLLISFWFERPSAATAGKKAFVVNRIGDVGFMLAMFLVFATFGSLRYTEVLGQAETLATGTATAIALLLFLGACGKSAQLPLHVWLPDAMEGPTPVSALIHAATMVTAGVYLMARMSPVLAESPDALTVIAVVGALTALYAATVACAQDDIKRVLAYSTISQLGYMFLAIGCGAYVAAVFHMVTHAFFKALLFLGAGSVIHGLHDEQDMKRMGGLRRLMPITAGTFIVGWLAIAGFPGLSGFWSKDDILLNAWDRSPALWAVGAFTALLTAYYMSRQVFLVFYGQGPGLNYLREETGLGQPRAIANNASSSVPAPEQRFVEAEEHSVPHESPWPMAAPLVVLAVLSAFGGLLNLPFGRFARLEHWLEPVFGETLRHVDASSGEKLGLIAAVTVLFLAGIAVARAAWLGPRRDNPALEPALLQRAWGIDGLYSALVESPGRLVSAWLAFVFDRRVIDGAVNGAGTLVRASGSRLRVVQTGLVRNYALGIAAGSVMVLAWFVSRGSL